MKGLQAAIGEGWLVQRARDMCSFSHDRYRQAAVAEAEKLPEEHFAKMSFRVGEFFLVTFWRLTRSLDRSDAPA